MSDYEYVRDMVAYQLQCTDEKADKLASALYDDKLDFEENCRLIIGEHCIHY